MDFDRWLNKSAADARAEINSINDSELELPDGLWKDEGTYYTNCCCCDRVVEMVYDLADYEPGQYYGNCGPRCIP